MPKRLDKKIRCSFLFYFRSSFLEVDFVLEFARVEKWLLVAEAVEWCILFLISFLIAFLVARPGRSQGQLVDGAPRLSLHMFPLGGVLRR